MSLSFSALPSDVCFHLLKFLTPFEVGRVSCVCVHLREEASKELLWKLLSKRAFSSFFCDGAALYEADKVACWDARRQRRQLCAEASRASGLQALRRWRAGEAPGESGSGEAAQGPDSGSDTELDELDTKALLALGISARSLAAAQEEAAAAGEAEGGAAALAAPAPPGAQAVSQAALERAARRRALRASRRSAAEHASSLRAAALEEHRRLRKRVGGSFRLAFPGIPAARCDESGVYALRCWYIRRGAGGATLHGGQEAVLKCLYHRVLLLRPSGVCLFASIPGELPEALRFFIRALGGGSGGGGVGGGGGDPLAEWGPPPHTVAALGAPSAPGDLGSRIRRSPEEGGVAALNADAAARPPPAPAVAPSPLLHRRGLPREQRGVNTLGRGVWRQEGRGVEVGYVVGGHNIITRMVLRLGSEEVGVSTAGEVVGGGGGGEEGVGGAGGPSGGDALFVGWSNTLTVEHMLVGKASGEEGEELQAMESLHGEKFFYFPLTSGVQHLP